MRELLSDRVSSPDSDSLLRSLLVPEGRLPELSHEEKLSARTGSANRERVENGLRVGLGLGEGA